MSKILDLLHDGKVKFILIGLLLILFIIIMSASMMKSDKKEETQKEEPLTNITITEDLKNNINRKINLLKYSNYCEITSNKNLYLKDCLYRKDKTTVSELSEEYKMYTLILATDQLLEEKNNYIVGNIIVDKLTFNNTQYMDLSSFENEYKSLYGVNSNINPSLINNIEHFPYVKYSEEYKKFFYQTTGEKMEITKDEIVEYANKYESDESNVYVYVNIAYVNQADLNTKKVYTDSARTTLISSINVNDYDRTTVITESNFEKFPTYKYTFIKEKDSDNLVFSQVEIVK